MDTIVAQRPITPNIPWELPNAIRPLDPTRALGSTQGFSGLDPAGGQAPVVNRLVNFGWEYVFHCHILGHEEFDFMRPMAVAVAPPVPPSGLTVRNISPTSVNLTWVDTTISETNWTVQRAPNATAGPWTDLSMFASTTGPQKGSTVSYIDATLVANTQYYYRVLATNIVGDYTPYPGTVGYPYLIVNSSPSNTATNMGIPSNSPTGVGVFRPSTHIFYLKNGTVTTAINWGISTDKPVTGDWNGDGITEVGVFRPSTHIFYWKNGTVTTAVNWGSSTDTPVTGDWNGDGKTEVGVFRNSTHLFYLKNGTVTTTVNWGLSTDLPVTGDWNADGRTEVGVFRPSTHIFYWKNGTVTTAVNWGLSTDTPVTGDWNADGRTDVGVFRNSTHLFYLKNGTVTTTVNWGLSTDLPVTGKWR